VVLFTGEKSNFVMKKKRCTSSAETSTSAGDNMSRTLG